MLILYRKILRTLLCLNTCGAQNDKLIFTCNLQNKLFYENNRDIAVKKSIAFQESRIKIFIFQGRERLCLSKTNYIRVKYCFIQWYVLDKKKYKLNTSVYSQISNFIHISIFLTNRYALRINWRGKASCTITFVKYKR